MMNIRRTCLLVLAFVILIGFPTKGVAADTPKESVESAKPNDWYVIGPEDVLEIALWKDPELTKIIVVRPDGRISFPLIGEVMAGGVTVEWLQAEIEKRILEYVPEPVVSVNVVEVNSKWIYVIGNVMRPGAFKSGRNINVLQALSIAGGLAKFADEDSILILRTGEKGQIKIPFNYKAIKKGKDLEQNIFLETGDVVVVP